MVPNQGKARMLGAPNGVQGPNVKAVPMVGKGGKVVKVVALVAGEDRNGVIRHRRTVLANHGTWTWAKTNI